MLDSNKVEKDCIQSSSQWPDRHLAHQPEARLDIDVYFTVYCTVLYSLLYSILYSILYSTVQYCRYIVE